MKLHEKRLAKFQDTWSIALNASWSLEKIEAIVLVGIQS